MGSFRASYSMSSSFSRVASSVHLVALELPLGAAMIHSFMCSNNDANIGYRPLFIRPNYPQKSEQLFLSSANPRLSKGHTWTAFLQSPCSKSATTFQVF